MGAQSRITAKGQTTIPAEVRSRLNLKTGDRIEYIFRDDEVVIKARNRRIADLAGILHRPGMKAVSIEEMDEAIMDAAAEDDERIKREWREGAE